MGHTPPVVLGNEVDPDTFYQEYDASALFAVESSKYTRPEVVLVDDDPTHIWIDDDHLVETPNRRLSSGKYLLTRVGGQMLYEVIDVRNTDTFDSSDVPDIVDDVQNPTDELVLEHKYDFESVISRSGTTSVSRYQFETEAPLNMGHRPPKIFEPAKER